MTDKNLPPNFYLASYLKKAGIRFEVNVVDTVIAKGLGIGSYIIVLLLLFFNCSGLFKISLNNFYFVAVNLLGVLYLLYVFIRLFYFKKLRKSLRKDPAPVTAEAYAVVVFDELNFYQKFIERLFSKAVLKNAVIYKESGALKPRFYTGAVKSFFLVKPNLGQIVRVYPHRKNIKLYSVDDTSAFQTVSARNKAFAKLNVGKLEAGGASKVLFRKEKKF